MPQKTVDVTENVRDSTGDVWLSPSAPARKSGGGPKEGMTLLIDIRGNCIVLLEGDPFDPTLSFLLIGELAGDRSITDPPRKDGRAPPRRKQFLFRCLRWSQLLLFKDV